LNFFYGVGTMEQPCTKVTKQGKQKQRRMVSDECVEKSSCNGGRTGWDGGVAVVMVGGNVL